MRVAQSSNPVLVNLNVLVYAERRDGGSMTFYSERCGLQFMLTRVPEANSSMTFV